MPRCKVKRSSVIPDSKIEAACKATEYYAPANINFCVFDRELDYLGARYVIDLLTENRPSLIEGERRLMHCLLKPMVGNVKRIMDILIFEGVVEKTAAYIPGHSSFGYRMTPQYRLKDTQEILPRPRHQPALRQPAVEVPP